MLFGRVMHRHELTEQQWQRIKKVQPKLFRQSKQGERNFINAVLWLMKTGSPWRDLPERYGNWKTIYNRFARWALRGHFEEIFMALKGELDPTGSLLDATIARAHQDAAGGKGGSKGMRWVTREGASRPSSTPS
jgi:transposase